MRIVGGKLAGRNLFSPQGPRVRPTAEPVRDAMMQMLAADLDGARMLDLFAGTGAIGLEALSRGAARCDFVEFRPDSLHSLRANVAALRMKERTRIFKRDALPFVAALPEDAYDIAVADPPYESRMLDRVIDSWTSRSFSRVLLVEHAKTHQLPAGTATRLLDDTRLTLYRR